MQNFHQIRSKSDNKLGIWFKTQKQVAKAKENVDIARSSKPRSGPDFQYNLNRKVVILTAVTAIILLIAYMSWDLWYIKKPEAELASKTTVDDGLPFEISSTHILFEIGSGSFISLTPTKAIKESTEIKIILDDPDIVHIPINSFTIDAQTTPRNYFIPLHSKHIAGHCVVSFKTNSKAPELQNLFKIRVQVKVVHQITFGYLSIVVGWIYFTCWSTGYYPQIYQNYRRKSVVGFSFDYLALNLTGHICYFIFNFSMYTNVTVQKTFATLHPKAQIPVHLNDVLFSAHAITMNLVLVCQCLMFERGDQKISVPMKTLVGGLWLTIAGALIAAIMQKLSWLQYLYYLCYIKVGSTPIKYTPQVYMNYSRGSTEGWSIQGVLLGVGGDTASFAQMAIDAVNNDDWDGTLGNPGKLSLSLMGMFYDSIFLTQHFICFGGRKRKNTDKEDHSFFRKRLDKLKASFEPSKSKPLMSNYKHKPQIFNL